MGAMPTSVAASLARAVVDGGYASLVLDRLNRQARGLLDVDRTSVLVRDPGDEHRAIAAAVSGPGGEDIVGSRLVIAGLAERVLRAGRPAFREQRSGRGGRTEDVVEAHAGAPIEWRGGTRGALLADVERRGRGFDDGEIELMCELAGLLGIALSHAERRHELHPAVRSKMAALTAMVDLRDGYSADHAKAVFELARRVGTRLGMGPAELFELELSALLHDIGKVGVPESILNKPSALTPEEWDVMRCHPEWGARMLPNVPGLEPVGTVVRYHHERWDGCGYPQRLRRERIPRASRVLSVCDAYEAMTSDRPYRRALTRQEAIARLDAGAGSQFDPVAVRALVELVEEEEEGLFVVGGATGKQVRWAG